ncbi:MAG: RHS repeat-associated core domain-containing protein [Bacteroidales bacterium]
MESFVYDNLDRLKRILGYPIQNAVYAANGNITSNTAGGSYTYWADRQHAVKEVAKSQLASSQPLQDISYTKFNKADLITQKTTVTQKTLTDTITYGPDQQRVKTIYTDTSGYKTLRYYSGSYEKDSMVVGSTKTVKKIHYIMGGTGLVAVYIKWSTGQDSMFYVCKDRQGSIVALVKQNGTVSERYSYDAWGRRRNPSNWADYNVPAPRLIARGYTGHEHLDGFGLINMNGRMYDPVIGRVLSPDNFVQDPTNTQSYNRYSYCLNNPLRYTDPSGWLTSAGWAEYYENKANSEFAFLEGVGFRSNPSYSDNGGGGGSSGISWTDYLHDPSENFVMMSSKAYNQMYGPGKYVKMQAARRNSDFCGPDKYGVYSKGSTVTNRFGKWFFTSEHGYVQIEDYTIIENVPSGTSTRLNVSSKIENKPIRIDIGIGKVRITPYSEVKSGRDGFELNIVNGKNSGITYNKGPISISTDKGGINSKINLSTSSISVNTMTNSFTLSLFANYNSVELGYDISFPLAVGRVPKKQTIAILSLRLRILKTSESGFTECMNLQDFVNMIYKHREKS